MADRMMRQEEKRNNFSGLLLIHCQNEQQQGIFPVVMNQ